ncbi:MAG: KEOPS complex kinase/ATPase Bud32 [Nanoarchaeota archaeon]
MVRQEIGRGAEAVVFRESGKVIKTRVKKGYRHLQIDCRLRQTRTRAEARILKKLHAAGLPVPACHDADEEEMTISMEWLEGKKLRDVLEKDVDGYCIQVGRLLRQMHDLHIIHSDLTTSNMIVHKRQVYLIDFGLAYFSRRVEDKAVDLHLLRQALNSYHHTVAEEAYRIVLESYDDPRIEQRLAVIKNRGRYKKKVA